MANEEFKQTLWVSAALDAVLSQQREFEQLIRANESSINSYREMTQIAKRYELDQFAALEAMTGSVEAARLAGHLDLPNLLQQHRYTDDRLASTLIDASGMSWWKDYHLEALNSHAALSNMLDATKMVGSGTLATIESTLSGSILGLDSVREVRQFLDISGLLRFPRFRILTRAEKRGRMKMLVKENAPSPHVRKAHSFNHRYELTLRAVVAKGMEEAYGENWPAERLHKCGCKKLFGKALGDGETVLDHADFTHYAEIMCHEEHFEAVFSKGFEDSDALREVILRLGRLRARSHHARTFTADDFREFVATWRLMEAGWIELVGDVEIDP
jgi:hypothetical protein